MTGQTFALFDTAVGTCGIVWGAAGVSGFQLPEGTPAETRVRIGRRFPGARESKPPGHISRTMRDVIALLEGEPRDLSAVPLDMAHVPEFHRRVYEIARTIPPGSTMTYGEIASRLSQPGSARAVGQALGSNPFAVIVPCHRVLSANGKLGGFSARGGVATKRRILEIERAPGIGRWALDLPSA